MTGQHNEIHLHFMLPGHTKFAPDGCFRLLKKKFRTTHVSSLQEMAHCVFAYICRDTNLAQLVPDENNEVFAQCMTGLQHFRFNRERPGCCTVQVKIDGIKTEKIVLTCLPQQPAPTEISPQGLARERWEYLFQHI
ncbi:hypothetical protein ElyMa_006467900 [Elysia marginata]|uniref:Uncharacterized protein n=1 Tax=Elysia marginata TaxID=1093978 RepID=A0AAV4I3T1_9GAST|nr:hypothetical protein ElyMa_006467900 [Elysia marginata]